MKYTKFQVFDPIILQIPAHMYECATIEYRLPQLICQLTVPLVLSVYEMHLEIYLV